MDTPLSEQLYQDNNIGSDPKKNMHNGEDGVTNGKPKSHEFMSPLPKSAMRNGENKWRLHDSTPFTQNRSSYSENRRGYGNFRPSRNLAMHKSKVTYTSERNELGSTWRRDSDQQQSKWSPRDHNDDTLAFVREEKILGREEGIPGFYFPQMKELLEKNSMELLKNLIMRMKKFTSLLKQKLGPDMLMLVVEMLAKISTSPKREDVAALLAHSIQPNILEQFSSHSFDIVAQNLKYSPDELIKYFENLYTLYNDVMCMMPAKASEVLSDHPTRAVMALQNLKAMRKLSIPPKLEQEYKNLMASVEFLCEQRKSAAPKKSRVKVMREWQPGVNFRELSINPLSPDLLSKSDVNICPAVVEGPYKSVEHYLDVQFNLMREDFLIPLREGIANFVEHRSSKTNKYKRIENVRFYDGVRFVNQFVEGDVIVTEVLFNRRAKSSRHNWRRSKRLLYGSLLCFSSDLFSSIILGVVVDRQVELLEKGILRCELLGDVKEDGLFKKEFIMAESEVYFEAYQHVMRALQNFDGRNFPLQEYLIHVTSDLHLPSYLVNDPHAMYKSGELEFPVLNEHFWPNMDDLKVNESQFKALHSALTKKCTVIQGPPGTGKTYLGLVIAKLLLENSAHWRRGKKGPILVVCFTNHALDQFLEGILSFTKNIVRIGNQSKSEKLNEYNLRAVRKTKGIKMHGFHDLLEDMENSAWSMNHNNSLLKECVKNAGILSPNVLYFGMGSYHRSCFTFQYNWSDSNFVEWLLEGAYFQNFTDSDLAMDDVEPVLEDMMKVYALSLQKLMLYIGHLRGDTFSVQGDEQESLKNIMMMQVCRFHYMKKKLAEPYEPNMEVITKLSRVENVYHLHPEDRWLLYKYWVSQAVEYYQGILMNERQRYQYLNKEKSVLSEEVHLSMLKDCDVVGMTTTGAARHQSLLQRLGPKIVIVEEAAEAMESHIVVCLSSSCEHLILIGDHKQLRPSPAVYKLAKDYNLEISLFERMLMNGVKYDTLKIQHRMRPDIADLVFPAVYPVLENHPSVMAYDNVLGLHKNIYFITHSHLEQTAMDDMSKKNPHEAEFLIALCRHIILQGYDPSQVTVLTTYLGQMFLLTEEREKYSDLKDVRIAVVDNFQGEENDIILLSLVRNNEEGKIGFVASENRTCVALSRAKKGLYIIGNISMLAEKSCLWSKVRKVLQDKEAVGTHLTLQCLKHPEQLTDVSKAEDFNRVKEGGCTLMCLERVNCGHICKKKCHIQGHEDYKCPEICNKVMCGDDHRCQKLCWQSCGDCEVLVTRNLPCGHTAKLPCHIDPNKYKCPIVVSLNLPGCEHTNEKPCYVDLTSFLCSFPCGGRLPCGHICINKCHFHCDPEHLEYKCMRPCDRKNLECQEEHMCQKKCYEECGQCTVKIKRKLPSCGHVLGMQCAVDPSSIECQKPCAKKLDCGHKCPQKCIDACGGCQVIVEKVLPECQHKMKMKCCQVPVQSMCKEKCVRSRSCGHMCTDICGVPCNSSSCDHLSDRTVRALCGHDVKLFCNEAIITPSAETLMKRCNEACSKILECTHTCKGTCGECMQGRIHITCQEKCGRKLICGHKCQESCSQACPQCKEDCFVRCEHFKCKNKCGKPCSPCKKPCGWQCEHQTCNKMCSDFCDRPPCNEPCKKKLKCGHECIGFCGEKCPDLCRVCNPKAVKEAVALLGAEGGHDSRFILLPDCGHVFELAALEKSLYTNATVVKMLECPQCNVPIQQAYRYRNAAKNQFSRVMRVKYKVFANLRLVNNRLMRSTENLWNFIRSEDFKKSQKCLNELQDLIGRNKKAHFGAGVLNSLEARADFVMSIVHHFNGFRNKVCPQGALQDCIKTANLLIRKILTRLDSITTQEHSDYESECMRFHLMMQLHALEKTNVFQTGTRINWYQEYEKCKAVVKDAKPFPKDKYKETHDKINEIYNAITRNSLMLRTGVDFRKYDLSRSIMREVVPAIDLHQGRWNECPNGHIFVASKYGHDPQTGLCCAYGFAV